MVCPKCNIEIPDDSTFCGSCGAEISPASGAAPGFDSGAEPAPVRDDYPFASLGEAWRILTTNVGEFLLATLVVALVSGGLSFAIRLLIQLPAGIVGTMMSEGGDAPNMMASIIIIAAALISGILSSLILAPLHIGYVYFILRKVRNEGAQFGDLFAGFTKFLIPSLLTGLAVSIIVGIGVALCVIPGIIAGVACMFAYFLVADGETGFMQAIMRSKDLAMQKFGMNLLFGIVAGLISMSGALACCVGSLFTTPLAVVALALVYNNYIGRRV